MARHFRCTGCLLGYPPESTVLSTFSKRIRYEGASVGFTSHRTLLRGAGIGEGDGRMWGKD
jgi:hypothetical protein